MPAGSSPLLPPPPGVPAPHVTERPPYLGNRLLQHHKLVFVLRPNRLRANYELLGPFLCLSGTPSHRKILVESPPPHRKDYLPVKEDQAVLLSLDQDAHNIGLVEHLDARGDAEAEKDPEYLEKPGEADGCRSILVPKKSLSDPPPPLPPLSVSVDDLTENLYVCSFALVALEKTFDLFQPPPSNLGSELRGLVPRVVARAQLNGKVNMFNFASLTSQFCSLLRIFSLLEIFPGR